MPRDQESVMFPSALIRETMLHQADGSSRQGATIAPDVSPVAVRPSWLGRTAGTSTQLSGLQVR